MIEDVQSGRYQPPEEDDSGFDALDLIEEMEAGPGVGEVAAKGFKRGVLGGIGAGIGSIMRWAGDLTEIRELTFAGIDTRDYFNELAERYAPSPEIFEEKWGWNWKSVKRGVGVISEAVPSLGAAIGVGAATKNPFLAASFLGFLEGAPQYEEARDKGKNVAEATLYGALSTGATTALEYLPMDYFLKRLGGKEVFGGAAKRFLGGAGREGLVLGAFTEGVQEGSQQIAQNMVAKYGYDDARLLTEGLFEAILGGAGSGGIAGGTIAKLGEFASKHQDTPGFDEDVEQTTDQIRKEIKEVGDQLAPEVEKQRGLFDATDEAAAGEKGMSEIRDRAEKPEVSQAEIDEALIDGYGQRLGEQAEAAPEPAISLAELRSVPTLANYVLNRPDIHTAKTVELAEELTEKQRKKTPQEIREELAAKAEARKEELIERPEVPTPKGWAVQEATKKELKEKAKDSHIKGVLLAAADHKKKQILIPKGLSEDEKAKYTLHEKAHVEIAEDEKLNETGEAILSGVRAAIEQKTPSDQVADTHGVLPETVEHMKTYLDKEGMNEADLIEEAYAAETGLQEYAIWQGQAVTFEDKVLKAREALAQEALHLEEGRIGLEGMEPRVIEMAKQQKPRPFLKPQVQGIRVEQDKVPAQRTAEIRNDPFFTESWAKKQLAPLDQHIQNMQMAFIDTETFMGSEFYDGTFEVPAVGSLVQAKKTERYTADEAYREKVDAAFGDLVATMVDANRKRSILLGDPDTGAWGVDYSIGSVEEKRRGKYKVEVARAWNMEARHKYPGVRQLADISVREALQNSLDAVVSAKRKKEITEGAITIATIENVADDKYETTLIIGDNGIGMSDADIADKFLALHGTGKDREGEFGGFGIAKAVILSPDESATWRLWTRDNYFTHEMAQTGEIIERSDKPRQGTTLEIKTSTEANVLSHKSLQYAETTVPPKGITIKFQARGDTEAHVLTDPFKGLRRKTHTAKWKDHTTYDVTYFPKVSSLYNKKMIIRLVGKKSRAKLTQSIRPIYEEGFAGTLVVDITTTTTPSHSEYPLTDSRMDFKYGEAKQAIDKILQKYTVDKKSAQRQGVVTKTLAVANRPEWKKTLKAIETDDGYQALVAEINKIYVETNKFFGHEPSHKTGVRQVPFTPLENMAINIDVGTTGTMGGSITHAKHLLAYEAVARLLQVPLNAKVGAFYALVSKVIDGGRVESQYNALTGNLGLNHLTMNKGALKNPTVYAQYLKSLVVHELTHNWFSQHNEDFSSMRESQDTLAAPHFDYVLRIAEAALGKKSELRKVTEEKIKEVEKVVTRVVQKEIEKHFDPQQLALFDEIAEGGYGGYQNEIFLSPESRGQLRLFPSRDDRLASGWGSTQRVVGTGRAAEQPTPPSAATTGSRRLSVGRAVQQPSPEQSTTWRRVTGWVKGKLGLQRQVPEEMSEEWKDALDKTEQYSVVKITRPIAIKYPAKGRSVEVTKTFLVSFPEEAAERLRDQNPQIVLKSIEDARKYNADPERVKDFIEIYGNAIPIEQASKFKDLVKQGKLEGVIRLGLTKGCLRVPVTLERVEVGLLPPETMLQACYGGTCFMNFRYSAKIGISENIDAMDFQAVSPERIEKYLSSKSAIAALNRSPFIREGAWGDSSHSIAANLVEPWLHFGREFGLEKPTVLVSSAYAPVTDDQYKRLAPYSDRFILHVSVAGWFTQNENMQRLAEFQAARDAGLPVGLRIVTNRDNIGDLPFPNEEWLLDQMHKMKIPEMMILETPYHDDNIPAPQRGKIQHRSNPSGEFPLVCAETGMCGSCGVKCMIKKFLGAQQGKPRTWKPPQYSIAKKVPVTHINHVGGTESANDDWRVQMVHDDLRKLDVPIEYDDLTHNWIDLSKKKDFLKAQPRANVTILHWIPDESLGKVGVEGEFEISPLHHIDNWKRAIMKADSDLIYVFGGMDEISGEKIGHLPGYEKEFIGDNISGLWRYTKKVPEYEVIDARRKFLDRQISNLRDRLEAVATPEATEALTRHDLGIPFYHEWAEMHSEMTAKRLKAEYENRFGKLKHYTIGRDKVAMGDKISAPASEIAPLMYKVHAETHWTAVTEEGLHFQTGHPITFNYVRNTEKAPDMGERFQQHIEPAGHYMLHNDNPGDLPNNWKSGKSFLEMPLVIAFNTTPGSTAYDETSWKANLSRAFGGLSGMNLTRALQAHGFDGIVTVALNEDGSPMDTREIIAFPQMPWFGMYNVTKADKMRLRRNVTSHVTLGDIQRMFPGQHVGISAEDGSVWVRTRAGEALSIKAVEHIEPDTLSLDVAYGKQGLDSDELIAGKYHEGKLELQRDFANRWTLAHESAHWMEDMGIIDSKDVAILKGTIARLHRQGKFDAVVDDLGNPVDLGGIEDRANFIARELVGKPKGAVATVIRKIQDFIDRIVNLIHRTAGGVVRDIQSGAIYDRGTASGHGVTPLGPASPSTTGRTWHSTLVKWVIAKGPNKAAPSEWKKTVLRTMKKGQEFKAEELKWSGLVEWLDELSAGETQMEMFGKNTLAKEQIVQWLAANNVTITEKAMSGEEEAGERGPLYEGYDIYEGDDNEWILSFDDPGPIWGDFEDWSVEEFGEAIRNNQPGLPNMTIGELQQLERFQKHKEAAEEHWQDMVSQLPPGAVAPQKPDLPKPRRMYAETPLGTYIINVQVEYGDPNDDDYSIRVQYRGDTPEDHGYVTESGTGGLDSTAEEIVRWELQQHFTSHFHSGDRGGGVRHSAYQMEGPARLYEELLLYFPTARERALAAADDLEEQYQAYNQHIEEKYGGDTTRHYNMATSHERAQLRHLENEREYAEYFGDNATFEQEAHWRGQKNVLVHVRFNERTDLDGKRVLFIEEIQSDWHGDARRMRKNKVRQLIMEGRTRPEAELMVPQDYGYKPHDVEREREAAQKALKLFEGKMKQKYGLSSEALSRIPTADARLAAALSMTREELNQISELQLNVELWRKRETDASPVAPWKSSYGLLAMKRMIRWASQHGYERIAWTPGHIQADRWTSALRHKVDRISWERQYQPDLTEVADWHDNVMANVQEELFKYWDDNRQRLQALEDHDHGWRAANTYNGLTMGYKMTLATQLRAKYPAIWDEALGGDQTFDKYIMDRRLSSLSAKYSDLGEKHQQEIQREFAEAYPDAEFGPTGDIRLIGSKKRGAGEELSDAFNWSIPEVGERQIYGELASLDNLLGEKMASEIRNSKEDKGFFEGDTLTIGAQGFVGFYDRMLVKQVGKFITQKAKGWNSKGIKTTQIPWKAQEGSYEWYGPEWTAEQLQQFHDIKLSVDSHSASALRDVIDEMEGNGRPFDEAMGRYGTPSLAHMLGGKSTVGRLAAEVWAFDVTPQMQQDAMQEGMPMYQVTRRFEYPDVIKRKFAVEKPSLVERIRRSWKDTADNWRFKFLDRLDPIKEWLGDQPYILARLETGMQASMAMLLRHGKLRYNGKVYTVDTANEGFLTWLDSLEGDDAQKLLFYVAAKRSEQLGEHREFWLDEETRREILAWVGDSPATAEQTWESLNDTLQEWNKSILDLAEESGLFTADSREIWEQHYYLPFFRAMEDPETLEQVTRGPQASKKLIDPGIYKLKGAEKPIGDPFENLMRMWTHLISETMRNNARGAAFDAGITIPGPGEAPVHLLLSDLTSLRPGARAREEPILLYMSAQTSLFWASCERASESISGLMTPLFMPRFPI
jgi:hypothetical protein